MLGCGRYNGGRIRVVFGEEMERVGMVTGTRAKRLFE